MTTWPGGLDNVEAGAGERLHSRLESAASDAGLLDVAYRTLDTPIGRLLLAATEQGLVRVAFAHEDSDWVLEELSRAISPRVLRAPGRLDEAAREIEEYFARRRREFELSVDLRLSKGFRRQLLARLQTISYGTTASYGALAAAVGHPGAARAVGSACATNPVPIVVPCHRVVRSDGTPGQYGGGADVKVALLEMEAAG
jgi:methylated-DNA-[protein]-cysteine S-methyltransferase